MDLKNSTCIFSACAKGKECTVDDLKRLFNEIDKLGRPQAIVFVPEFGGKFRVEKLPAEFFNPVPFKSYNKSQPGSAGATPKLPSLRDTINYTAPKVSNKTPLKQVIESTWLTIKELGNFG